MSNKNKIWDFLQEVLVVATVRELVVQIVIVRIMYA